MQYNYNLIFMLQSGCIWPVEGMPRVLQWLSFSLPTTIPGIALRGLLDKGYAIDDPQVYSGFLVAFGWTAALIVLCFIRLRLKAVWSKIVKKIFFSVLKISQSTYGFFVAEFVTVYENPKQIKVENDSAYDTGLFLTCVKAAVIPDVFGSLEQCVVRLRHRALYGTTRWGKENLICF